MKRIVLDTNVLVRAFLGWRVRNASSRVVELALRGARRSRFAVIYDSRIVHEWREVLLAFGFNRRRVLGVVRRLVRVGHRVRVVAHRLPVLRLRDRDDRPFIEVAVAGRAWAVITFNSRDFPKDLGYVVAEPAHLLEALRFLQRRRRNPSLRAA